MRENCMREWSARVECVECDRERSVREWGVSVESGV